jgi:hypothetical protein
VRARPAAPQAAAALRALPIAAVCGGLDREPVTVPTVTGPVLSANDFRARAEAACTRLFSRLDALGTPPTWHALLGEVGPLRPPDDLAGARASSIGLAACAGPRR